MNVDLGLSDPMFWTYLLQIIGVDLILSGDNAIVIALACRSLPKHQQRIGVILGGGAAVALRIIFAAFVTFLMGVPYLKLIGGILLFWVGYKLILPEEKSGDVQAAGNLWGAVRTVLLADAVMSLDNVLAVAAAAHGSVVLLVIGLLISIPLVIGGATLLLRLIERFPFIVTMGAALIGYIAGEVIVTDVALEPWIATNAAWLHYAAPALGALIVVVAGQIVAPQTAARSAGEAVAGPAGAFGLRALLVTLGQLILLRASWVVALIGGALGFAGGRAALQDELLAGWADAQVPFLRTIGPFVAAAIAVAAVELATRLRRGGRGKANSQA